MTLIHGQIGALKQIKKMLYQEGISRFNSVGDIQRFLKNYDNEIEGLFFIIECDFDFELDTLQAKGFQQQKNYNSLKAHAETYLQNYINQIKAKCDTLNRPAINALLELLNWYRIQILLATKFILKKGFHGIVKLQTYKAGKQLKNTLNEISWHYAHRQAIISTRYSSKLKELEHIKSVADSLQKLIVGSIGENLVAKELQKLSDSFVLINDFSMTFDAPIHNKQKNTVSPVFK